MVSSAIAVTQRLANIAMLRMSARTFFIVSVLLFNFGR